MQGLNVNIAVCGKFHYTNYVKYISNSGRLNKFYYSHKISTNASSLGLPSYQGVNAFPKEYLAVLHEKYLGQKSKMKFIGHYHRLWEWQCLKNYSPARLLHILNHGTALNFIDRHSVDGSLVLGEALNSHPIYSNALLQEEHERLGINHKIALHHTQQKMIIELGKFNYLLAPSLFVKNSYILNGFSEDRILTIPFGVNSTKFSPLFNDVIKKSKKFRVIYVAQIIPRKGHIDLLKAWELLNLPNAELVFIGSISQEMKPILNRYKEKFIYLGTLSQQKISEELCKSNVFVMPSIEEGCAYAPIEAMSCGVPLILTNHTGSAELISEGKEGFVIPIHRPDLIARRILQLYQSPKLNEWMGHNARKLVDEKLDWSHYAKRLMTLYDNLLK